MICPSSPYPELRIKDSPKSQRSAFSFGGSSRTSRLSSATSAGSRSTKITYKSETTTTNGLFGKKKKDAIEWEFDR
jgi:hypothetical protein